MQNPLSNQGYDIDIATRLPVEAVMQETELLAKRRLRKLVEDGQSLIAELSDNRGVLVEKIVSLYINRVNDLIASDPECQTYEKLFSTIQYNVNIGKGVVTDRAKNLVNL